MESLTTRFQREVFYPYLELLKAQYRFHPVFAHAKKIWEEKLTAQELVNGPYLEKSQIYQDGKPLDRLELHEYTAATIQQRLGGRPLWKHQTDALELLLNGKNVVISTGTSSGKTLCYQIPILDDLIRDPSPGLRAVIVYPLNALVNDQLADWEEMLKPHPQVTFARFTGQTPDDQIDYERRLRDMIRERLTDQPYSQQALQREVQRLLEEGLRKDENVPNRLNHRVAIRSKPPHVLVTNFSMLEYLLERPVDVPIFENAHLKFLVLDEVHAYRGVQATEIAFLTRRLKDRLGLEKLTCIATSATLGRQGDIKSQAKVRKFVAELFGDDFPDPNPVYGSTAEPVLEEPSFYPTANEYLKAIEPLRKDDEADVRSHLRINISDKRLTSVLNHDGNLYRLRKEILTKPTLLSEAAKLLWPGESLADDGLQALLEIVATVKVDESHEDLLPTRLHYFVKAQDGLHICLHKLCPGRNNSRPAFFVSRKNDADTPDGYCPDCHHEGRQSKLVEVVTCRKCGYLFGALQDLGPRRAREPGDGNGQPKPYFDSFSTELGWVADSYWSYFSVEDDLPYPSQPKTDEEEEDQEDLFINPAELQWCVACGKKKDEGEGDNCRCEKPHLRKIKVFHRQCPATDRANLDKQEKVLLTSCPNCGARNGSGIEPVRRFQESDDEMGLGMAIPLAHFQVTPAKETDVRKLLCFTDHRQRAAAFPSLLEEETFGHDMGRKIIEILDRGKKPLDLRSLGFELASIADPQSEDHDPDFFLPVSRYPDEELDEKEKRDLWVAETFGYFGIPDSARESAEDLGLVAVEFHLSDNEKSAFRNLLNAHLSLEESESVLQVLLGYMRQRKAFTLPPGVQPDAPAFGRVTADIAYVLRREGNRNTYGWLPHGERDNVVTDYLKCLLDLSRSETLSLAEQIWQFLISKHLLIESKERWKLDHEHLFITKTASRYVCNRCGIVTAYCARNCCPRKKCIGTLESQPFDSVTENIISQWVAGVAKPKFTTLKSEEHTAQISKDLAKAIEEEFRAEGVDLLSSTTTFELGINIGDLQKVLLRNAPPTSASYVQRVGRAGRGRDKNAISVTLCRRTKYDADAWNDPPRLMSGEVRPPTVFIQNKFIAQRHFNAAIFAKFLQVRIAKEHILGQVRQQVRLEAFLPVESRTNIPEGWFQIRPTNLYLDFLGWLDQQSEMDIFQTNGGRSMVLAVSGFNEGTSAASKKYKEVLDNIAEELSELMTERQRLFKQGGQTADIEQAIKDLLRTSVIDVLAKRGFLPRYAFPLDVVTLETGTSRWSREADVELNRDRGIAIAEFAPGAQVIAHKKVFTSAGLYVVSKMDRPDPRWYSKCPSCEQIRTAWTQDSLIGHCVCQRSITTQYIQRFIEPLAFSVRVEKGRQGTARHRRSTLIRQRQTITHFIDHVDETSFQDLGLFRVALKEAGSLFRYNLGPENKGFMLCPECGYSEPLRAFKAGKKHKRLRAFSATMDCKNDQPWKRLAYGYEFRTFCLIVRPNILPPSVQSLAFALQKGLCLALEIEPGDIGVAWRWLANEVSRTGIEIILYDHTPGGSGFVKEGFENWEKVVEAARKICEGCTCLQACYVCLKDYNNQSHHEQLNRLRVIEFLESLV